MTTRVLILEDHRAMRDALAAHVTLVLGDVEITAPDVAAIPIDLAHCDVALVDMDLGDEIDTLACVRTLVSQGTTVILTSAVGSPATLQAGIREGAWNYSPKSTDLAELAAVLRAWRAGQRYLGQDLAAKLVTPHIDGVELDPLTRRALTLHSTGMTPRAISTTMGLTTARVDELLEGGGAAFRAGQVRPA